MVTSNRFDSHPVELSTTSPASAFVPPRSSSAEIGLVMAQIPTAALRVVGQALAAHGPSQSFGRRRQGEPLPRGRQGARIRCGEDRDILGPALPSVQVPKRPPARPPSDSPAPSLSWFGTCTPTPAPASLTSDGTSTTRTSMSTDAPPTS
jgi:hypothetical protein